MKITCGPENTEEFKKQLKQRFPGVMPLIKSLYTAGMIDGLRGITISPLSAEDEASANDDPEAQEINLKCGDCKNYRYDTVGFGDGIGECKKNIQQRIPINPRTNACALFEARK